MTLFAASGALIERGEDHRLVWDLLGVDRPANDGKIGAVDFDPDALPCLRAVREAGYRVGLAGNQPAGAETALGRLGLRLAELAGWPRPNESLDRLARAARYQEGSHDYKEEAG